MLRFLLNPKTVVGAGLGFGVAYLLDPDQGRSRRARTRDQVAATLRRAGRDSIRKADYAGGQARGVLHHLTSRPSHLEDRALADRVKSTVLGDARWKGQVDIDAVGSAVSVRGQLPTEELIRELEQRVQAVDGVESVESFLHTPDEPAPNKARALQASRG